MIRFGAANRDERKFEHAEEVDLDREKPRAHLAFSNGKHHCLGASLARRELYFGFRTLFDRVDKVSLASDNDFAVAPNYFLRSLKRLNITFTAR